MTSISRQGLFEGNNFKLSTILGVYLPLTVQRKYSSNMSIRHHADNSDKICVSLGSTLEDRVSIRLICNSLHYTAKTV